MPGVHPKCALQRDFQATSIATTARACSVVIVRGNTGSTSPLATVRTKYLLEHAKWAAPPSKSLVEVAQHILCSRHLCLPLRHFVVTMLRNMVLRSHCMLRPVATSQLLCCATLVCVAAARLKLISEHHSWLPCNRNYRSRFLSEVGFPSNVSQERVALFSQHDVCIGCTGSH